MSKETPIEELIRHIKSKQDEYEFGSSAYNVLRSIEESSKGIFLPKDKAHREKYKHTKEDVINSYCMGSKQFFDLEKDLKERAEQYYKEQHEKE